MYVIQKTGNDGIGKTMSFADVRAMGKDGQTVEINDYLIVEGYVVSNRASGNVGENEKLSLTASDNTSYKKKFYLAVRIFDFRRELNLRLGYSEFLEFEFLHLFLSAGRHGPR